VLGCTSAFLDLKTVYKDVNEAVIVFLSDGRFHIESTMLYNPTQKYYQYNPYNRRLTLERYGYKEMQQLRLTAINVAKNAQKFGLIFGTLGRQGSPELLSRIISLLEEKKRDYIVLLISEINERLLETYGKDINVWVQLCCPRLSVDWGHNYIKPLLNPYEIFVALGTAEWSNDKYPMDNYSYGGGPWSSYYGLIGPTKKQH